MPLENLVEEELRKTQGFVEEFHTYALRVTSMYSLGTWRGFGDGSDDYSDSENGVGKEIGACDPTPVQKAKVAISIHKIRAVYTVKDIEAELGSHAEIKVCDCKHKKQLGGCLAEHFRHGDGSLDTQALCAFVSANRETCRVKSKEDIAIFGGSVYHDCIDALDKKRNYSGVCSMSAKPPVSARRLRVTLCRSLSQTLP